MNPRCPECGTTSKHKATCSKPAYGKQSAPSPLRPSTPGRRAQPAQAFDVGEATVEQLVETIETCKEELRVRRTSLAGQTEAIERALGVVSAQARSAG